MAARYHFVTRFCVDAEPSRVWDCLVEVDAWPRWWRWLLEVKAIEEGNDDGVGSVFRQRVTSPLGYGFAWDVEIVRVNEGSLVELDSTGALEGRGRFTLETVPEGTVVAFVWLVRTTKRWMNLLYPVGRPVFRWSHDRLMDDFARGMAAATGSRLMWLRHESLSPGEPGFFEMPAVADQ